MSGRFQQRATLEVAPLEDGMILLDPETNEFSVLNHTASVIWTRVAEPATVEEIASEISRRFAGVTEGEALPDVQAALRQMVERQLVTEV